jgi:hypothetical protein
MAQSETWLGYLYDGRIYLVSLDAGATDNVGLGMMLPEQNEESAGKLDLLAYSVVATVQQFWTLHDPNSTPEA